MAAPQPTPFAVNADIAPLQAKYFQSAARNISDPTARAQTYDLIRRSFGDLQTLKDAQTEQTRKDQEFAVSQEINRARLDQARYELFAARDKAARDARDRDNTSMLIRQMRGIVEQPDLDDTQKYSAINDIAATGVAAGLTEVGSVAGLLTKTLPKFQRSPRQNLPSATEISNRLIAGEPLENISSSADPTDLAAGLAMAENQRARDAAAAAKDYGIALDKITTDYGPSARTIGEIDDQISNLDKLGVVTDEDRLDLWNAGIKVLGQPKGAGEAPGWMSKVDGSWTTNTSVREDQKDVLKRIARRAISKSAALTVPARAPRTAGPANKGPAAPAPAPSTADSLFAE